MAKSTFFFFFLTLQIAGAQQEDNTSLPYAEIPAHPEVFNACTTAARMIDGLGFRYYWATEGLTEEDLNFKPSPEARTTGETIEHIYGLSLVTLNAIRQKPNIRPAAKEELSFAERRSKTLYALQEASQILKSSDPSKMADFNIVFQRGEESSTYPFWNLLNGPLADAMWHVGQVVAHRRTSGNPINSKVNVFQGKLRGE